MPAASKATATTAAASEEPRQAEAVQAAWASLEARRPLPMRFVLFPSQRPLPGTAKAPTTSTDRGFFLTPALAAAVGKHKGGGIFEACVDDSEQDWLARRHLRLVRLLDPTPSEPFVSLIPLAVYAGYTPLHMLLAWHHEAQKDPGMRHHYQWETEGALLGVQPWRGDIWLRLGPAKALVRLLGVDDQLEGLLWQVPAGAWSLDEAVQGSSSGQGRDKKKNRGAVDDPPSRLTSNWIPAVPSLPGGHHSTVSLLAHTFRTVAYLPSQEPTLSTLLSSKLREELSRGSSTGGGVSWSLKGSSPANDDRADGRQFAEIGKNWQALRTVLGKWTIRLVRDIEEWAVEHPQELHHDGDGSSSNATMHDSPPDGRPRQSRRGHDSEFESPSARLADGNEGRQILTMLRQACQNFGSRERGETRRVTMNEGRSNGAAADATAGAKSISPMHQILTEMSLSKPLQDEVSLLNDCWTLCEELCGLQADSSDIHMKAFVSHKVNVNPLSLSCSDDDKHDEHRSRQTASRKPSQTPLRRRRHSSPSSSGAAEAAAAAVSAAAVTRSASEATDSDEIGPLNESLVRELLKSQQECLNSLQRTTETYQQVIVESQARDRELNGELRQLAENIAWLTQGSGLAFHGHGGGLYDVRLPGTRWLLGADVRLHVRIAHWRRCVAVLCIVVVALLLAPERHYS